MQNFVETEVSMKNSEEIKETVRHIERIQANPAQGLTAEQVQKRFDGNAYNYKVGSSTLSVSEIVRSNVFTYFNLVFAVIAVLLAIVGAWSDMMFLPSIVANTCIGIVQEVHSKHVLDKLSLLNAPQSVVIRDGQKKKIPAEELVLDDVVEVGAGSQIPADAVILEGELQVNESLITGEADEGRGFSAFRQLCGIRNGFGKTGKSRKGFLYLQAYASGNKVQKG